MTMIFLPALIYTAQFVITDYLIKYRSSAAKRSLFFNVPAYSYGDDSNYTSIYPDSYELQEISIPRPDEGDNEVIVQATSTRLSPTCASGGVSSSPSTSPSLQPAQVRHGENDEDEDEDNGLWDTPTEAVSVIGNNENPGLWTNYGDRILYGWLIIFIAQSLLD